MVLAHVAVMPHGAMVLDRAFPGLPPGAATLGEGCRQAARRLATSAPELVVLTTPHGIALPDAIAVYGNHELAGSAEWLGGWSNYGVQAAGDPVAADSLLECLQSGGLASELVTAFSAGVAAPLRWGEAAPLYFLQEAGLLGDGSTLAPAKVLVISWPTCRQHATEFIPIALRFGELLRSWAALQPQRVALLASCDMSHVHEQPPGTTAMFSSDTFTPLPMIAKSFDASITGWAGALGRGDLAAARGLLLGDGEGESSTGAAAEVVEEAKACGWGGFLTVQACLEAEAAGESGGQSRWAGELLAYEVPSYYGMMVASFSPTVAHL